MNETTYCDLCGGNAIVERDGADVACPKCDGTGVLEQCANCEHAKYYHGGITRSGRCGEDKCQCRRFRRGAA